MKIKASQVQVGDFITGLGIVTEIMPMHQDRAVTRMEKSKKEPWKNHARLAAESIEQAYTAESTEFLIRTASSHRIFEADQELIVHRVSRVAA